jgi:hypothetical protein
MRILVAIGLAALALVATSSATAADQSVVGAYGCFLQGGHVYAPAGTEIVVRFGWAAKNRGLVQDFLNDQTTTVSMNGGEPVDVSGSYGDVITHPAGAASYVHHGTGVSLAPGESLTFHLKTAISHPLLDGVVFADGDSGRPLLGETGTLFETDCTVTGV